MNEHINKHVIVTKGKEKGFSGVIQDFTYGWFLLYGLGEGESWFGKKRGGRYVKARKSQLAEVHEVTYLKKVPLK